MHERRRTNEVLVDDVRCGVHPLDLRHLPNLLGKGHPPQQVIDPRVQWLLRVLVLGMLIISSGSGSRCNNGDAGTVAKDQWHNAGPAAAPPVDLHVDPPSYFQQSNSIKPQPKAQKLG